MLLLNKLINLIAFALVKNNHIFSTFTQHFRDIFYHPAYLKVLNEELLITVNVTTLHIYQLQSSFTLFLSL